MLVAIAWYYCGITLGSNGSPNTFEKTSEKVQNWNQNFDGFRCSGWWNCTFIWSLVRFGFSHATSCSYAPNTDKYVRQRSMDGWWFKFLAYVLVDWAFGAVHVKIAVAFTLLGPNWWLRDALENIYNQECFDNDFGTFHFRKLKIIKASFVSFPILKPLFSNHLSWK